MQDLFSSSLSWCIWLSESQPPEISFERNDPCSPFSLHEPRAEQFPPLQVMLLIQCVQYSFPKGVPHTWNSTGPTAPVQLFFLWP